MKTKITKTCLLLALSVLPLLVACSEQENRGVGLEPGNLETTADGVIVELDRQAFQRVRLQVVSEDSFRVTAVPGENFDRLPNTLMVVAEPQGIEFGIEQRSNLVVLSTSQLSAEISLENGAVTFMDAEGGLLLAEAGRDLVQTRAGFFSGRQQFQQHEIEALYGLGQQQDGRVNYAGKNIELTTHNIEIAIPYLASSRGYGLLWNNSSITRIGSHMPPQLLSDSFALYDAEGNPGGLTARYYDGDELKLERVEQDLNYQFLARASNREFPLPAEVEGVQDLRVQWQGAIVPMRSGVHELKMYSSGYARLSLDGELLLDRWRMNWNPWFHNASVDLEAGHKYRLSLDWKTQGGYFRLLHYPPRPAEEAAGLSITSDSGEAVDYYFVAGDNMDKVIAGYRELTGKATMLPRWAFGFWQSRERYKSQDELLGILETYREREIPIDNIVLDWSYWPVDAWGSHEFDQEFFPDPSGLVNRVHELDARIMISVWPKFYPETANYRELDEAGCMFNKNIVEKNFDWIGSGYLNAFYDAFDSSCRSIYWRQVNENLNVHGFDAWWLDAVEPDMHSNLGWEHRKDLMTPNGQGSGADYFNAYALPHAEGVYQGERETDGHQRSFILTRSGFGGIQRTGSAIWSGDVVSRWSNLKEQIAAGIGVGLSGMPYWTFDIGGFTPEDHYRYHDGAVVGHYSQMAPEYQAEWQELNLRWFQFGAFTPLFRSHGQNPYREIFNLADEGSEVYDSLVWYTKLRYRLMPYIYTLAGDSYHLDGTIMRGLVMDFPDDPKVRDIATQYMFGPAFLVNPVYVSSVRSHEVYLPAGTDWYEFHTGNKFVGGQTIEAAAPLARMPLYVRAGSIVPTGPVIQHSGESLNAPVLLNVYTGADGYFELYEDDGLSYGYESGQWSRIPVTWDDSAGVLTIGARSGGFEGMAELRDISVRWITGSGTVPSNFEAEPGATLTYDGKPVTVSHR